MKPITKFFWSLCMLILALVLAILQNWVTERVLILCAMGMAFIGDMCLMTYGVKGGSRKLRFFIAGMIHFALAHIIYAVSFIIRVDVNELARCTPGFLLGYIVMTGLITSTTEFLLKSGKRINNILFKYCMFYSTIIGLATIVIFGYSFATASYLPAIGITLFFVSDCLIAIRELIKVKNRKIQTWIWILYVTGQTLLIIG